MTDKLPALHEGGATFWAGEHRPARPDYGHFRAVRREDQPAFTPFGPLEAAHLSARLALPSTVRLTTPYVIDRGSKLPPENFLG